MRPFGTYLKDFFHNWWAGVGALSVVGFFVPRLNDYWPYIAAVAVLAFIGAGFVVDRQRIQRHDAELERIRREHDAVIRGQQEQQAANVSRLEAEIAELRRPKFTAETRKTGEEAYRKIDRVLKVALRHLLIAGNMTDRQALNYLHTKGMATNYGSIFSGLVEQTPFVHRTSQPTGRDRAFPYEGDYTVNPTFREVLTELIEADPESQP
ncbi:MAG TPA: hypothetical protein VI485_10110 [Vicinamibacterales bacterium]|nr:hypothetical protein [Vicinamibacterales bacterium]